MFDDASTTGPGGSGAARPDATGAEIDALEARLAGAVGLLNATATVTEIVAEALESGAWEQAGIRSPAHWLAWQSGMSLRRAEALVAFARRRAELPVTTAAFGAGSLSEDQVVPIARHVPAAHDEALATFARNATASQVDKVAREYSLVSKPAETGELEPPPDDRAERNQVTFGHGENGRWQLRADLDAAGRPRPEGPRGLPGRRVPRAQPGRRRGRAPDGRHVGRCPRADGRRRPHRAGGRPPGGRAPPGDRPRAGRRPGGAGLAAPRPALPSGDRRRISCDATMRFLLEDDDRVPLKLGRKQRSASPQQRVVVENRDKGCRRPGCNQSRWLHIHHLDHWEDGGTTDVDRMCALCPRDHDLHHRGLLGITSDPTRPDGLTFTDHHGRVLQPCGTPTPPDQTKGLDGRATELGISPPDWQHRTGERLDRWWVSFGEPPPAPPEDPAAEDEAA